MNFQKYKQEMNNFLNDNYKSLKRVKIRNSEFALKEFLQTEQADINNYANSLVRKITSDARKSFVTVYDVEKGYEIGEKYKASIKVPKFEPIEVNFAKEKSEQIHENRIKEQTVKRQATQSFEAKSPANRKHARNLAVGAGVVTSMVTFPARFLTAASLGTSLVVAGFSAIIVAGVVYTVVSYIDANGQKHTNYVAPSSQAHIQKEQSTVAKKKTIDQPSMSQLLDLRKAEAQRVLLEIIEDAQRKYEQLQTQAV